MSHKTSKALGEYESLFKLRDHECPYCKSHDIVKNGHTKYGVQKYVCKSCDKNFNGKTNTVLAHSKHGLMTHLHFLKLELWCLPLKTVAEELHISVTSAFYWRHKLYKSIKEYNDKQSALKGDIELDSTYIKLGFKGEKEIFYGIPDDRGINNSDVCINTLLDEYDHIKFKVAHLNHETIKDYQNILIGNNDIKHITSDGIMGIENLAKELKASISIVKADTHISDDGYNLAELNELHNEIKDTIRRTRGVALKHLEGYLDMVVFRKHMSYHYDKHDRLYRLYERSYTSNTAITNKAIYKKPLPIDLSPLKRCFDKDEATYQSFG